MLPALLRRLHRRKPGVRLRDHGDLRRYVARTAGLCVAAALAFDVVNQLTFFTSWTAAFRSWAITVGVVLVIAVPVARSIGRAHLQLYRASRIDGLTGVLNRRALFDSIEEAPNFAALAIVDVDRFKQVNDTYGHLVGDHVLRAVAHIMALSLGELGPLGRLGGEEFAILASKSDLANVMARLEEFRHRVAVTPVVAGSIAVSITISAGVAARAPEQSFEQHYARADRALYRAKAAGRNQIVLADATERPEQARTARPAASC